MKDLKKITSDLPEGTVVKDVFLGAIATNQNAKKALQDLLSDEGYKDAFGSKGIIAKMIEKDLGSGTLAAEKAQRMLESF
jgi:hypothetical protein